MGGLTASGTLIITIFLPVECLKHGVDITTSLLQGNVFNQTDKGAVSNNDNWPP